MNTNTLKVNLLVCTKEGRMYLSNLIDKMNSKLDNDPFKFAHNGIFNVKVGDIFSYVNVGGNYILNTPIQNEIYNFIVEEDTIKNDTVIADWRYFIDGYYQELEDEYGDFAQFKKIENSN